MSIFCRVIFVVLFLTFSIKGWSQNAKSRKPYFKTPTKIGLVVVTNPVEYSGKKDLPLGPWFTHIQTKTDSRGKYNDALSTIEPELEPTQRIKDLYLDLYAGKGKQIIPVTVNFDTVLADFRRSGEGISFYNKDLRFLKAKLNVDELLIVFVRYGLSSTYSRFKIIEWRNGIASIKSKIIDLKDNSIIVNQSSNARISIDGEWDTPPAYENIKKGILSAIEKAINTEKKKYDW